MNIILVPYDFSAQSQLALDWSVSLSLKTKSKVILLYVHESQGFIPSIIRPQDDEELLEHINDQLDTVAAKITLSTGADVEVKVLTGRVYRVIVEVAASIKATFIVMGMRSHFPDERDEKPMPGRNTSRVIRMAGCPVITLAGNALPAGFSYLLLPLDLTKITRQKTAWAIRMAGFLGTGIKAVSALWTLNDPEIMARLLLQMDTVRQTIEAAGIACRTHLIETPAGEKTAVPAILDYVEKEGDIGLIVIMTQQERALVDFFVGSHAQEFIRCSPLPVMSVVPEEQAGTIY
ncbi:MAG: universal stress protein [Bacteroidales bacterium]|nr:universal stress protein [Bacteroidales bacterium]